MVLTSTLVDKWSYPDALTVCDVTGVPAGTVVECGLTPPGGRIKVDVQKTDCVD
jgi:hypothetical protein